MSPTFSFTCIKNISCLPSPCTRLSLARTTTEAPLPCRIFISLRLIATPVAFRFRQSPFRCAITQREQIVGYDLPFTTYCSCVDSLFMPIFQTRREVGTIEMTILVTLRQCYSRLPLRSSFNQIRFYPHICSFHLPISVAAW